MVSGDSPEITSSPVYYVGAKEHTWRDLPTFKVIVADQVRN